MRLFVSLFALALLVCGCGKTNQQTVESYPPTFKGTPAETRINWDLAGNWTIFRFQTKEKPSKKDRWEAKWLLESRDGLKGGWRDKNGQGVFWLSTAEVGEEKNGLTRIADLLVWEKPDGSKMFFSVNQQSFGFLQMTGDDDEGYMAVRSD